MRKKPLFLLSLGALLALGPSLVASPKPGADQKGDKGRATQTAKATKASKARAKAKATKSKAPYTIGPFLRHQKLTLVTLYSKSPTRAPANGYLTFEEAAKKKLIRVTELEGNTSSARVNAVEVSNLSKKPIFLMAGEVILGGKQDRIISQNTVIDPRQQKLQVKVFCVEQGRWQGKKASFRASGKLGHSSLRSAAVFNEQQGTVWQDVAEANKKQGAKTQTGTYKASLEKAKLDKKITAYRSAILPKLKQDKRALGLLVAINGEVIALDAFANPALFGKVRDKLVASYILEASSHAGKVNKKPLKRADVMAFFAKISKANKTAKNRKSGKANNVYYDAEGIEGMATQAPRARSKGSADVHTFFRKKVKRQQPKQQLQREQRRMPNRRPIRHKHPLPDPQLPD